MSSSKGQSANELLIIYMFVMLMFTVFVLGFSQQRSAEIQNAKVHLADSVGEMFASELNSAARAGNGYSRKIIYPVRLDGVTPYTVILNNISNTLDIQFTLGSTNYSHSFPVISTRAVVNPELPVLLPNGTGYGYLLHSDNLTFSKGDMYIQNIDGAILISTLTYFVATPWDMEVTASPSEIGLYGSYSDITATVFDRFRNPVPDGVLVHFQTSLGAIDDFAPTLNGTARTVLVSGVEAGVATVNVTISASGRLTGRYVRVIFVG